MTQRKAYLLLMLLGVTLSGHAVAQTIAPQRIQSELQPTGTLTLGPRAMDGAIGGGFMQLMITSVSLFAQNTDVMMNPASSTVSVSSTGAPLPAGTYSLRFDFSFSNPTDVIQIKHGESVVATCSLQLHYWSGPAQSCDSGPIEVTDGKLAVTMRAVSQVTGGVGFRSVTVTYYQPSSLKLR